MVAQCKWGKECVFLAGFRCKFMHKATDITDLTVEVLAQRQLATERKLCVLQHRLALTAGSSRRQPRLEATQHRPQAQLQATRPISPPRSNFSPSPKAPTPPAPLSRAAITTSDEQPSLDEPPPNHFPEPSSNLQPEVQRTQPSPSTHSQIISSNSSVSAIFPPTSPSSSPATSPIKPSLLPVRRTPPTNQHLSQKRKKDDSPAEATPALKKLSSPSKPSASKQTPNTPTPGPLRNSSGKSPISMKSPASDLIEAAKELNIEVLNPSPEVLEEAFGFYLTTIRVEKRTMDVDEGLLRKTFFVDMSPKERLYYVYTVECEARTPVSSPRASPAKARGASQQTSSN